jgi:hypothetical protein
LSSMVFASLIPFELPIDIIEMSIFINLYCNYKVITINFKIQINFSF